LHWKRHEKEEREARKKAEREALERQREEEERREAERQQRKLNFLITQTELYSHFIGKKIGQAVDVAEAGSSKMDIDEDLDDDTKPFDVTSFNDINFDEGLWITLRWLLTINSSTCLVTDSPVYLLP